MPRKDPYNLDLQNGCFIVREELGVIFAICEPYKLGLRPSVKGLFCLDDAADLKKAYPNHSIKYPSRGHTYSKSIKIAIDEYMRHF